MQKLWTILFIISALALSACVPTSSSGGRRNSNAAVGGSGDDGNNNDDVQEPIIDQPLFWFSNLQEIVGTITVNKDIQTGVFLRGQNIHNFLSINNNSNKVFCLVINIDEPSESPNNRQQLRVRAIPDDFNNAGGFLEWVLFINLPQAASNASTCGGTVSYIDVNGLSSISLSSTDPNQVSFDPLNVCPTCSNNINSVNIRLYEVSSNSINDSTQVSTGQISLDGLGLRIDPLSDSNQQTSSCSTNSCQAQGFDCCLSGQCVNDGAERPSASSNPDYAQALQDIGINPANFVDWPHIFFVCPSTQPVIPTPTPTPDAAAIAAALLAQQTQEFLCLEGAKQNPQDFSSCAPTNDSAAFVTIRNDVWDRCGCEANPFPTDPDSPLCPDFGLRAEKDANQNIISIECEIPQPSTGGTAPFQNLNVTVPVRSAPHRFFDQTGQNYDDITSLGSVVPPVIQEGDIFSYVDESGKTDPLQENFGMNAILGQMNVQLSRALPAKMIEVEFDQTYIVRTTSGFYTPCPTCVSDAWFNPFSAFPSLSNGNGLQAVGHTTSRNTFSQNTRLGNYEDTIFGRACWLPPTMIPYTHNRNSNLQQQRLNRLSAQAAFYANGYQRDWFGFNKGALIGSFDGVTWFAIGDRRRVRSTSTKLFLAINAPFADLADNTDMNVSIVTDQGGQDTAANFDFDPNLSLDHPEQNQAGSCQHYHQCNVDSDCVTQLGWEYVCLDTNQFQTKWPKFDANGNEIINDEFANADFNQILQGFQPTGVGSKRCVYRGSGSLCKRDVQNNLDSLKQKFFTCAPNFYCEPVGGTNFNSNVAREPSAIETILFGQEANILGRPQNYIAGTSALAVDIRNSIQSNASLHSISSGDFGLCRPGKRLTSSDPFNQHQSADTSKRTDYISQVSSCDSQAIGNARTWSCPVFETDESSPSNIAIGDYIPHNNIATDSNIFNKRHIQNACGDESSRQISPGNFQSPFEDIEAVALQSVLGLSEETLVKDACFRRPGSVCHTDLDCSPNRLHAPQAVAFGPQFFGNTTAEQKYWQESLICGQAQPQPNLGDDNFATYDITQNRCCREVGNDITMYTQSTNNASALNIIPDLGSENLNLQVASFPLNGPAADGRYSRYTVADAIDEANPAGRTDIYGQLPIVEVDTTPKQFQWKAINESGRKTCCGGGWVRKFADGTTNWGNSSRLALNYEAFRCLNYKNPLVAGIQGGVDPDNYNRDIDLVCNSPAEGGCIQAEIPEVVAFEVTNPSDDPIVTTILDTSPLNDPTTTGILEQGFTIESPYQPVPYVNLPMSASGPFNFMATRATDSGTSFYLPIYIDQAQITDIAIVYFKDEVASPPQSIFGSVEGACTSTMFNPLDLVAGPDAGMTEESWCIVKDNTGVFDVFHARAANAPLFGGDATLQAQFATWDYAGVQITFRPFGTTAVSGAANARMNAGNSLYYLTKLARLELLGIPQIFYEPLYCNDDRSKLVEDIFTMPSQTRNSVAGSNGFEDESFAYNNAINGTNLQQIYDSSASTTDASNPLNRIVYQDKVAHGQIFSGHEFKCCLELGSESDNAANCCSNHIGTPTGETQSICMLPSRTNLNVYFNKFVSGDGMSEGDLTEEDFIPLTGEPKLRQETSSKLLDLGTRFCENGVRQGAAFGEFFGEPNNGFFIQNAPATDPANRFNSIIDSNFDESSATNGSEVDGTVQFISGYRWNHQFYCQ